MAVGGARGIAVGGAAAGAAAGGGSKPGTSQDQRPRESVIGPATGGNPRSRGGFGGTGGRAEQEEEAVVVDGGGGSVLSIAWREARGGESCRGQGPEIFPPPHFVLFPLFASADGRGEAFRHRFLFVSGCGLKSVGPRIGG